MEKILGPKRRHNPKENHAELVQATLPYRMFEEDMLSLAFTNFMYAF